MMKKQHFITLALLAFGLLLVSCSKNDDNKPISTTGLYGNWVLDFYVNNGALVVDVACDEKVSYVFLKNSNYTKTTYAGEGSSKCVVAMVINGKWKNMGDNKYELKPNGSDVSETLQISFNDDFTLFTIVHSPTYTEVYTKK